LIKFLVVNSFKKETFISMSKVLIYFFKGSIYMKTRVTAFLAAILLSAGVAATFSPITSFAQASDPAPAVAAPATEAPAAEAPAVAEAAEPAKEASNPYGLEALWNEGGVVSRTTLIIMIIMSMGSWYIIITKLIDQVKLGGQSAEVSKFWKAKSVEAGISSFKEGSPFRFIAESATKAAQHHEGALLEQIDLNTWIAMSIQRSVDKIQSRLQNGLAFLATVGSTSPFVGLFGTVWGIYNALVGIGTSGQASIDKVAGPVGEALIMTAFGLAVAVPAVLGYNFLVRRNKSAMEDVRAFGADLHSVIISGEIGKAIAAAKK
jgi:biopolymer transport protein ExbB